MKKRYERSKYEASAAEKRAVGSSKNRYEHSKYWEKPLRAKWMRGDGG